MISLPKNPTPKDLADAIYAQEVNIKDNTMAIRAILTLLHPEPDHPPTADSHIESFHHLVMEWIEKYGRMEV